MIRVAIFILLSGYTLCVCSCGRNRTLLIKNVTNKYDSLPVTVKINDRIEFNDNLKKTNVSLDYYEKSFRINSDSICVDVELPTLKLHEHSCATKEQGNLVIVTINEILSQDSIVKMSSMSQNNALKVPKISIAFLKKKLDEVH